MSVEKIQKNLGMTIGFCILMLAIVTFMGDKSAHAFLILVLLGMLLVNAEMLTEWVSTYFKIGG